MHLAGNMCIYRVTCVFREITGVIREATCLFKEGIMSI